MTHQPAHGGCVARCWPCGCRCSKRSQSRRRCRWRQTERGRHCAGLLQHDWEQHGLRCPVSAIEHTWHDRKQHGLCYVGHYVIVLLATIAASHACSCNRHLHSCRSELF